MGQSSRREPGCAAPISFRFVVRFGFALGRLSGDPSLRLKNGYARDDNRVLCKLHRSLAFENYLCNRLLRCVRKR
jgi:hypothetical protein